jgi:proton-dependent oligopeptide transporter, POT family
VDAQYREPLLILILSYLLQTTGEFCLSPIGMSEITKLAPAALVSTMMAMWYLSISWGEWMGGRITQLAGTETVGGQVLDPKAALDTSTHVFGMIGMAAAVAGVAFLLATPWLKGWAHRARAEHTAPDPLIPAPDVAG